MQGFYRLKINRGIVTLKMWCKCINARCERGSKFLRQVKRGREEIPHPKWVRKVDVWKTYWLYLHHLMTLVLMMVTAAVMLTSHSPGRPSRAGTGKGEPTSHRPVHPSLWHQEWEHWFLLIASDAFLPTTNSPQFAVHTFIVAIERFPLALPSLQKALTRALVDEKKVVARPLK